MICDIQCGAEYQKLRQSGEMGGDDSYLELWWNSSFWLIQCQTIELLPKDHQANICMPHLWFGATKTNMTTFLIWFVTELKDLEKNKLNGKTLKTKCTLVKCTLWSAPSVARPLLRNSKQLNGKYGCDFSLFTGGGPYTWKTPEPPLRTETEHFEYAMLGTPVEPVMGVKGTSLLMNLQKFNITSGFVPEYHSVCFGTTIQLASRQEALWQRLVHMHENQYCK